MKDTKTGKKKLVTKSDVLVIHHSLNNYYTDWQMPKKTDTKKKLTNNY